MTGSLIAFPLRLGLRGAGLAVQGATAVAERLVGIAAQLADAVTRDGGPDLDLDGSEHDQPEPAPPTKRHQETKSTPDDAFEAEPISDDASETESTAADASETESAAADASETESTAAEASETDSTPDDESASTPAETAPAPDSAATASPPAPAAPASQPLPDLDPAEGHVSEEPTLVEEVAEAGAEDGAGAEVHVAEPWEGYREFAADDVIDRIRGVSAAELAAVELYELSHRNRKTVLAAVQQELARADR